MKMMTNISKVVREEMNLIVTLIKLILILEKEGEKKELK